MLLFGGAVVGTGREHFPCWVIESMWSYSSSMIDDAPAKEWSTWHSFPPKMNVSTIDRIGYISTW